MVVSPIVYGAVALSLLTCGSLGGEPRSRAVVSEPPIVRPLAEAPPPENFVAPKVTGLFAQLRARAVQEPGEACPSTVKSPRANKRLAPYTPYESPRTHADPAAFNLRQVVLKVVEGSSVRLRGRQLRQVKTPDAADALERLARSGLEGAAVPRELGSLNRAVKSMRAVVGRAAPTVPEQDLSRLRLCAERAGRREMPDLNLFYFVHLPEVDNETAQRFLARLRALRIVEVAYFQPIPFNTADIPPLTSIDVTPSQGYFRPAPMGIDVDYARRLRSGRGNTMRIADIEAGWNHHEDLPAENFRFGVNWGDTHGTAVLGELWAEDNGFGAVGIAPNAMVGWSSVTNLDPTLGIYFYSVGSALLTTLRVLRAGDIALIEQQFQPFLTGVACDPASDPCNDCSLPAWVAVEEYPLEHAGITNVTRAGLVVVEAAGNGRMSVSPASAVDSGAIVVGASNTNLAPACWSNFGPRVDVHGWGMSIGTTGYGSDAPDGAPDATLRANGPDITQWYTRAFGGTSGASPIVTGAAAIIQSARIEDGLPVLTSVGMRSLLASTGTPQASGSRNIGPLPNLRAAIQSFRPDRARFVRQTSIPIGIAQTNVPSVLTTGDTFTFSATFANSGSAFWSGAHSMSIAPSQNGSQVFSASAPSFSLGLPNAEVFPNVEVTRTFNLTAPVQPGTYSLSILLKSGSGQVLASSPSKQIVVRGPTAFDDARITIIGAPNSMPSGSSSTATVQVLNAGTTTWSPPRYVLGLQRTGRISLPQQTVTLFGPVPPGGLRIMAFPIICNGFGQGSFSAQMGGGATGTFGQRVSRTVDCR